MAHSQWDSPSGILLLGGYDSGDSTELVTSGGTSSQFSLNDKVRLGFTGKRKYDDNMICSYACAINNGSEVVLTGGFGNRRDVSVYSMSGFVRNLPDLNVGRQYHACARYQNQYDQNV